MSKSINALKKLEQALSETQDALGDILQVLHESSKSYPIKSNYIIPAYRFEAKLEEYQISEQLDQTHKELQSKAWKLRSDYQNPKNADKHETIQDELDWIEQQMTEIEQRLYYIEDDL